jgi:UrcA family protein
MIKFILAASAALALAPTVGHAETAPVSVHYGDLDLTSAAGQEQLDKRMATAARRTCSQPGDRTLREMTDYHNCIGIAMRAAHEHAQVAIAKSLADRDRLAAR